MVLFFVGHGELSNVETELIRVVIQSQISVYTAMSRALSVMAKTDAKDVELVAKETQSKEVVDGMRAVILEARDMGVLSNSETGDALHCLDHHDAKTLAAELEYIQAWRKRACAASSTAMCSQFDRGLPVHPDAGVEHSTMTGTTSQDMVGTSFAVKKFRTVVRGGAQDHLRAVGIQTELVEVSPQEAPRLSIQIDDQPMPPKVADAQDTDIFAVSASGGRHPMPMEHHRDPPPGTRCRRSANVHTMRDTEARDAFAQTGVEVQEPLLEQQENPCPRSRGDPLSPTAAALVSCSIDSSPDIAPENRFPDKLDENLAAPWRISSRTGPIVEGQSNELRGRHGVLSRCC